MAAVHGEGRHLVVRRFTATNTRLAIIPKTERKNPKVWDIYELEMDDLGAGAPSRFRAALTNPIPYGKIESAGHFGPWDASAPGASALEGEYTFAADLGTIKGLHGQLNAIGTMSGVLEQIATRGETRTPDFRLTGARRRQPAADDHLRRPGRRHQGRRRAQARRHHAGTLAAAGPRRDRRHARRSRASGSSSTSPRKAVNLAELLQLTSKAQPPMARGTVSLDAAFDLPQGDADVLQRLALEGSFRADRLRFADDGGAGQDRHVEPARPRAVQPTSRSTTSPRTSPASSCLSKSVLTYRGLAFNVQGASIKLDGTHRLAPKTLSLQGEVLLTASASNTLTGFKRWLVKPFDPLFRKKGAGTRLVIYVEGTQDQPKIGLELGKTLRGR